MNVNMVTCSLVITTNRIPIRCPGMPYVIRKPRMLYMIIKMQKELPYNSMYS